MTGLRLAATAARHLVTLRRRPREREPPIWAATWSWDWPSKPRQNGVICSAAGPAAGTRCADDGRTGLRLGGRAWREVLARAAGTHELVEHAVECAEPDRKVTLSFFQMRRSAGEL